jgi:predicted  nucleic acid-binding Zn-ribbon protein
MEISSMQVGFDALLSILSALVGALTVWFTLKNKVAIQQMVLDNLSKDVSVIHKRIDDVKDKVESNREKQEKSITDIRDDMAKMKIEIIEAIHAIKSK